MPYLTASTLSANVINFNGSSSNVYFSENIASFKELKEAVSWK